MTVGYATGQVESTNYQLIHQTDHAETVHLTMTKKKISLRKILLIISESLTIYQQTGNDIGRQYRTGV